MAQIWLSTGQDLQVKETKEEIRRALRTRRGGVVTTSEVITVSVTRPRIMEGEVDLFTDHIVAVR